MKQMMLIGAVLIAGQSGADAQTSSEFSYPAGAPQYYVECLRFQAQRADDGISDAATIASVIVPECRSRQLKFFEDRAPNTVMIDVLRQPATKDDLMLGVRVVLQNRAARR